MYIVFGLAGVWTDGQIDDQKDKLNNELTSRFSDWPTVTRWSDRLHENRTYWLTDWIDMQTNWDRWTDGKMNRQTYRRIIWMMQWQSDWSNGLIDWHFNLTCRWTEEIGGLSDRWNDWNLTDGLTDRLIYKKIDGQTNRRIFWMI